MDGRRSRPGSRAVVASAAAAFLLSSPGLVWATPTETPRRGPEKVLEVLDGIGRSLKATRYQHATVVRARRGEYFFDCSGMAEWVLRRSAPLALRTVARPEGRRPVAASFFRRILSVPPGESRGPWYRVRDVSDTLPGDVLTWRRHPWFESKSTGHVAFVLTAPVENPGPVRGYLFRVADASRFPHEDDTRGDGDTGFGTGVILVATDAADRPRGYGWYGSRSRLDWIIPCDMAIGRPLR